MRKRVGSGDPNQPRSYGSPPKYDYVALSTEQREGVPMRLWSMLSAEVEDGDLRGILFRQLLTVRPENPIEPVDWLWRLQAAISDAPTDAQLGHLISKRLDRLVYEVTEKRPDSYPFPARYDWSKPPRGARWGLSPLPEWGGGGGLQHRPRYSGVRSGSNEAAQAAGSIVWVRRAQGRCWRTRMTLNIGDRVGSELMLRGGSRHVIQVAVATLSGGLGQSPAARPTDIPAVTDGIAADRAERARGLPGDHGATSRGAWVCIRSRSRALRSMIAACSRPLFSSRYS